MENTMLNAHSETLESGDESYNQYAVVLFINENNAPGIVLTSWIYNNGTLCYYPTVKTNEARDRLLRKKCTPEDNWTSNNAIKLLHCYETFDEAVTYLRKAEETSNLSSDDEDEVVRRRKRSSRKKNIRFISEDEISEDESISNLKHLSRQKSIPYPAPIKTRVGENTPNKKSIQSHPLVSNKVQDDSLSGPSLQFQKLPISSCAGSKNSSMQVEIKEMLSNLCLAVQRLEVKVDNIQVGRPVDAEEIRNNFVDLPILNLEQFSKIEKQLEESTSYQQTFIKRIMSVGGRSARAFVQNMLRTVLSDSAAEMFSLSGKNNKDKEKEKQAFASSQIFKVITYCCKKSYKETDINIRTVVSDWLNQAKFRKIRREQRQRRHSQADDDDQERI